MRYWFDTEFIEDGTTIELISIGMVDQDGREFYAQSSDADLTRADTWITENVLPHLRRSSLWIPRSEIAEGLIDFVSVDSKPEFWAYYADYDWVAICQLFGTMMNLPKGWPRFAMDVKQLQVEKGNPTLPKQTTPEHHALNDALWAKEAWQFLTDAATPFTIRQRKE